MRAGSTSRPRVSFKKVLSLPGALGARSIVAVTITSSGRTLEPFGPSMSALTQLAHAANAVRPAISMTIGAASVSRLRHRSRAAGGPRGCSRMLMIPPSVSIVPHRYGSGQSQSCRIRWDLAGRPRAKDLAGRSDLADSSLWVVVMVPLEMPMPTTGPHMDAAAWAVVPAHRVGPLRHQQYPPADGARALRDMTVRRRDLFRSGFDDAVMAEEAFHVGQA